MPRLTVAEASQTYEEAMRSVRPAGPGICSACKTFIDPAFVRCYRCNELPRLLDEVVPITYSEHLGQVHTALRNYKEAPQPAARYAHVRLTAILWRFLEAHESCVARSAGVESFDLVTTVPSSTPETDERRNRLRTMVTWCRPVAQRFERVLRPTGNHPPGREFFLDRYVATEDLSARRVLLIDDTWASGGHAQCAGSALREAGAEAIALVVIGRHINPIWQVTADQTSGDLLEEVPRRFEWNDCAVHQS